MRKPVYHCKLCGVTYKINNFAEFENAKDGKNMVHKCEDGGLGVAEFCGFAPEEKDEQEE